MKIFASQPRDGETGTLLKVRRISSVEFQQKKKWPDFI